MANDSQNGYHPVQTTEDNNNLHTDKRQQNEKVAWQDPNLLPDEKCCCSALQRLDSPYGFCALACLVSLLLGAAWVATGPGALSTIEKRFQLKTSELAPFLIINDVINMLMVLFVAYYGHTRHRPRLIGGGTIIVGLGYLICTMPQFIYETPSQFSLGGRHTENGTVEETSQHEISLIYPVCQIINETSQGGADTEVCTEEEARISGSLMWQVSWIVVGQIMVGVGTAPLSPLAVTYIDDNMEKTSTAVFLACMFTVGSIGPFLGFAISSFSLSIHADFYKAPVYAQPGDPNWIGAWWLGFAITGVMITIIGIPITLFPKKIRRRGKEVNTDEEGKEMNTSQDGEETTGVETEEMETEEMEDGNAADIYRLNVYKTGQGKCAQVKGFLDAIRRLVTNLAFMSVIVGACAMISSIVSTLAFLAKYLETQFDMTPSATPVITGIITAPGMILGNSIGGLVIKKLKLTKKGMARMLIILKPGTLLLAPILLFLGCENRDIAGITTTYSPTTNMTSELLPYLTAACNSDCACPAKYAPICGSDGMTYATPCHAGCLAVVEGLPEGEGNTTMFTECSCIGATSKVNPFGLSGDYEHAAITGVCHRECNTLIAFVALSMIIILLMSITTIPAYMLQIRTVDDDDRSIALGFSSLQIRLLAMIPSPIVFGAVIQTACLLLQSSCGKTGNCLVYDIVYFRYVFFGLAVGLDVLSTIMFIISYFLIKKTTQPEGFVEVIAVSRRESVELSDCKNGSDKDETMAAHDDTVV